MKILKFNHERAQLVRAGKITATWRVNDEKNLSVDDEVWVVDKVVKKNPDTWQTIGTAQITEILAKHLGDIRNEELGGDEEFTSREEMIEKFRKYYGSDINAKTPVKVIHFAFTPQEPKPMENLDDKNTTLDLTEVKLYGDGGSRGNPGPSASGYVLMTMDDAIIFQGGQYLGITTNNQAEYTALRLGLEEAQKRGAKIVHIHMDSLLVINQMKGIYKIKNRDLLPIYQAIIAQLHQFQQVTFTHVPRELNKLADGMVNEVLDATDLN